MKPRIWLSLAHMSGREQEFIQEAFDTNWVVPLGPNVNAFEKSLRDFLIENGELKIENYSIRCSMRILTPMAMRMIPPNNSTLIPLIFPKR